MFDVELDSPHESLPTDQLRARFQVPAYSSRVIIDTYTLLVSCGNYFLSSCRGVYTSSAVVVVQYAC
jgi:hypothetical protein